MEVLLWLAAAMLVIVGLIGVIVPALPGTVLVFLGLLLGAWADDFTRVSIATIVVIGVIAAGSYGVDFVAAVLGTRKLGASRRAMLGAGLGTIAGLFFGLPGIILGPFIGAVIGELTSSRDLKQAGRAGVAAWIGFAIGTAVKVGIVFLMIGMFLAALFL